VGHSEQVSQGLLPANLGADTTEQVIGMQVSAVFLRNLYSTICPSVRLLL